MVRRATLPRSILAWLHRWVICTFPPLHTWSFFIPFLVHILSVSLARYFAMQNGQRKLWNPMRLLCKLWLTRHSPVCPPWRDATLPSQCTTRSNATFPSKLCSTSLPAQLLTFAKWGPEWNAATLRLSSTTATSATSTPTSRRAGNVPTPKSTWLGSSFFA